MIMTRPNTMTFCLLLQPTVFFFVLYLSPSCQAVQSQSGRSQQLDRTASATTASLPNGNHNCPKACQCPSPTLLDCSGQKLTQISPELLVFPGSRAVTKVDLSGNELKILPAYAFKGLPNLQEIDLSNNQLTRLDGQLLHRLVSVRWLDLSGNQFADIPRDLVASVKLLSSLKMTSNRIEAIKDHSFASNRFLLHLDLKDNHITNVTESAFSGLERLQNLSLANNHLETIHAEALKPLPSLIKLDLASNKLTSVPEAIRHLPILENMDLSKNGIVSIGENLLQQCPRLVDLELRNNPINSLHPNAFVHLPKLKQLIISEARLVTQFPNLNGTHSLEVLRFDRAQIRKLPTTICSHCPKLKSLELKSNEITTLPPLGECKDLRVLDVAWNKIASLEEQVKGQDRPLQGLTNLHDLMLSHNNISTIGSRTFRDLRSLQTLDLSHNQISNIHEDAFSTQLNLRDINVGVNSFTKFPTKGLKNVVEIKTHNNPNLVDFPAAVNFPNIQNLVLSYAYHCCQFIPSTYENFIPEYGADYDRLQEEVLLPGDFGHNWNTTDIIWSSSNGSQHMSATDLWAQFGTDFVPDYPDLPLMYATPPPGIQCIPAPGPFLPCNDLFDWWTLRCSVWIVFLLALLGNGCVVIVLVAARSKMDVPRFLVCNLAMADFCMGLYLGFLAIVDASTLGEFRKFAISWQFSAGCQAAGFLGVLSSELSVFTLAVITLERNYAITHAMHLNKRLSLKHAAYIMCAGWSFALIMASMPLIGVSDYRKFAVCLPFETGNGLSLGFVVFLMLINGVAFSILMGCYLKMYCAIRGSQAWNSNDSRIAKRMALLVFTDFICWAPIAFFALTASFGCHLINLEQAKVFTIFILPLNSCCNPFLYAILTKQFKKDCVMICKAIEESRVTRGIGRCRHSSNFSNRQTPANTNSLNSGSGTHGSHGNHSRGTVCSCNVKSNKAQSVLASKWPFNKLKHIFLGYKDNSDGHSGHRGLIVTGSDYTNQIAEIQHKQHKTKRHPSMSSDNFSSSRSDSWRAAAHGLPGGRHHGHRHHGHHRRRNSWTVTRKPSQDSQLSSSRNDSASSNSTNTWRMSRSSVSSDNSMARTGSGYSNKGGDGKLSALARAQAVARANATGGKAPPLARLATENAASMLAKPKLIRQSAILADGDSTGSGKSVSFQEPPGIGSARRFVAAVAEVGTCPLHSHDRYKALYEKLVETAAHQAAAEAAEEESDMEASDAEDEELPSDGLPLGTTYRTMQDPHFHHLARVAAGPPQPPPATKVGGFLPRKLSTISSKDRESNPDLDEIPEEEQESPQSIKSSSSLQNLGKTSAEVHSSLSKLDITTSLLPPELGDLKASRSDNALHPDTTSGEDKVKKSVTTHFEWHGDVINNDKHEEEPEEPNEKEALLSGSKSPTVVTSSTDPFNAKKRYRNTDV